ncbi:MAG: hypothetical protein R3D98_10105 [Candidatus Krumholzibacteriia bacterium]
MPGLYGLVRAAGQPAATEMPPATRWPRYRPRVFHRSEDALLGAYLRHRGPDHASSHDSPQGALALWGHAADPRTGRHLDAAGLAAALAAEGDQVLDRLEGAFCALELDRARGRGRLFNDRLGTLALYWHHHGDLFAVAPRLGLLPEGVRAAGLNPGAVVNFLSIGHFLGPNTPWKAANHLTPATIVAFDLTTGELTQRRYWNLRYEADTQSSTDELCRRLGEAIQESTALLTAPTEGKAGIFLSGGWDSRSLLGAAIATGRPPALAITNGVSDEIPGADTWLAKRMARDLGLDFRFCRRDPEIGPAAWLDGLHKGEITTANNPENFGQHHLPADYFGDLAYMLKGDVTWGSGAPALTEEQSVAKIVPYPLADRVKGVLQPDLRHQADTLYREQIDSVVRHCQNDGWTERRDYLWQMGGINRYILGLGISDEEHIQVRRPLLAGKVFEVYTTVPRHLRCHKNLFIERIQRFYPRLFAYGRNHVSNIAHYYHYMAPYVREVALAHLDAGHDLDGHLDAAAARRVLEGFAPALQGIYQPGWKARLKNRVHDRVSHRWYRTRWYKEKNLKKFTTSETMLAFHLYLLLDWYHGDLPAPRLRDGWD